MEKNYDLEERTSKFGESVLDLCKEIPRGVIGDVLIRQIVRSATSVGANYSEANGASSRRDFKNKIQLCKREAQETRHWLRMIAHYAGINDRIEKAKAECSELILIFQKVVNTINLKDGNGDD